MTTQAIVQEDTIGNQANGHNHRENIRPPFPLSPTTHQTTKQKHSQPIEKHGEMTFKKLIQWKKSWMTIGQSLNEFNISTVKKLIK